MRTKNPSNIQMINGVLTDKYGRTFEMDWESIEKTKKSKKTATVQNSTTLKLTTMETKKQQLPDWFRGEVYKEGGVVYNPFTEEKFELNNLELSMYDFVNGCSMLYELRGSLSDSIIEDWQKGLGWFRETNPKAYMVLLD
jgi:hypothetical protein